MVFQYAVSIVFTVRRYTTIAALTLLSVAWLILPAHASDWYVSATRGNDRNSGRSASEDRPGEGPFRTIAQAISSAEGGDTIHLLPQGEPYRESVVLQNRVFPADRPLTIDGHDQTISGLTTLDLTKWEQVEPGLYRSPERSLTRAESSIGRFFFRFDGVVQRMGRTSKGRKAPFKAPSDLKPGEWTFDAEQQAYYVKLDPNVPLDTYHVEAPVRSNGVQLHGRNENIIVRNLHVEHVINDGFNIHGYSRGVVFENVSARECGDDGISAHEDCHIRVDGFVSIANSTGFCHIGASHSDSNRVLIRDCLGYDVFVLDQGRHTLTNSLVISSSASGIVAAGPRSETATGPKTCQFRMNNVAVVRAGTNEVMRVERSADVEIDRCTIAGFHLVVQDSSLRLRDSILCGLSPVSDRELRIGLAVRFEAQGNLYDLARIQSPEREITRSTAGLLKGDIDSRWENVQLRQPFDGSIERPASYAGGVEVRQIPRQDD